MEVHIFCSQYGVALTVFTLGAKNIKFKISYLLVYMIPLSRFWISATRGVNKNFYLASLLEIGLTKYEVTHWRARNCIWSTKFPGGIQDIIFYLHHERHDDRIFEFWTLLNSNCPECYQLSYYTEFRI